MTALVIRGDARHLPLPDQSVDLVVTSPPFLNLRSYQDDGQHYQGQIGTGTREQFLEELWQVTVEIARVLKPTGSILIELGDSYTDKSLNLSPHRFAIGCVDKLGLLLRAEIIWDRPNGLPESVTDRVRRSHSVWWHLTKQPRYYSAVDEIREPHAQSSVARAHITRKTSPKFDGDGNQSRADKGALAIGRSYLGDSLGKLPGSVWTIPTEPLTVPDHLGIDHFAAYPTALVKPIIRGWSPPGICVECGEGRRPIATATADYAAKLEASRRYRTQTQPGWGAYGGSQAGFKWHSGQKSGETSERTILGYVCACTPHTDHPGTGESSGADGRYGDALARGDGYPRAETDTNGKGLTSLQNRPKVGPWREYHFDQWTPAPTRPSVILDPFSGTGTTALVASALGRIGIGIDLSFDYSRLAQWRTTDRAQIAKVLEVPKPPVIPKTQLGFDFEDAS